MALDDVINLNITASAAAPSQPGFGTPLLVGTFPAGVTGSARVRKYSAATALTSMVADGFTTAHPLYKMASLALSQSPRPSNIKLGKRLLPATQVFKLTCLSAVQGDVYTVDVKGVTVTYTVLASATTSTVATALATLINTALGGTATAAASVAVITCTGAVAGVYAQFANWSNNFTVADTSADPGIATDLAACLAEDSDFYGVTLDTISKAEIMAAAAWVEANKKLFAQHTCDTACGDNASTTDVMYAEKALAHARTYLQFCGKDTQAYGGAAILGSRLPATPGSDTWDLKTLVGIPADDQKSLTPTQQAAIIAKNGNVYVTLAGINVTQNGVSPSGAFLDITRFCDWLRAKIQIDVFAYMINVAKVPYTDLGTEAIATVVRAALAAGVRAGGLVLGTTTVTADPVLNQSTTDRAARKYGGISFSGRLAGAIHTLDPMTGTVGV